MAESASILLADLAIIRALTLQRVSNGLSSNVAFAYNAIIEDIASTIKSADDITLKNMRVTIAELKTRVTPDLDFLQPELEDLAIIEAKNIYTTTNAIVGIDIYKKIPPDSTLKNIFKTSLMNMGNQADTIPNWFENTDKVMMKNIEGAIKLGIVQGENNYTLANRVKNILNSGTKEAKKVMITSVAEITNRARDAVWDENNDVIDGYDSLSVLDGKTSKHCAVYDGQQYDVNRKPIKGNLPYSQTPSHPHCRRIHQPRLKTWQQMGIDADEISEGTKSSLNGYVPKGVHFDKWIDTQPKKFQEKWFGKTRYAMYKSGKITFSDLLSQNGEVLTIAELKAL